MNTRRVWLLLIWCGIALATVVTAQPPDKATAKPPVLSEIDKRDLLLAFKDLEIAQLKVQALVARLTPPGYQLNDKLELVPVKPPDPKGVTP